jgi:hypothetical protein
MVFAISLTASAYLASKWHWITNNISLARAASSILPLLLLPIALLFAFAGWGDPQEHLVRGFLHVVHRALSKELVGNIVLGISVAFIALAAATLVWLAVSVLTTTFRARNLVVFCASSLLLGILSSFVFVVAARNNTTSTIFGVLFIFCFGALFAVALVVNGLGVPTAKYSRPMTALLISLLVAGSAYLFFKSSRETQFAYTNEQPLWTLDIASAGCNPAYGGPTSDSAPNEIAFATGGVLGMAVRLDPMPQTGGSWKLASCALSIDASTGKPIAHKELPIEEPSISAQPDGNLSIGGWDGWAVYSPGLEQIGNSRSNSDLASSESGVGPGSPNLLKHFIDDQTDASVWYQNGSDRRRIATCSAFPRALNNDRVLIAACTKLLVFDGRGNLVGSQDFVRPEVNFAALSRDHSRFAIAVYVWGFGDPSYLEEETIAVYDVASLRPVFALKSDPLPAQQSWVALSPDGSLMAVGAGHTLRLFRLPPQDSGN